MRGGNCCKLTFFDISNKYVSLIDNLSYRLVIDLRIFKHNFPYYLPRRKKLFYVVQAQLILFFKQTRFYLCKYRYFILFYAIKPNITYLN